MGVVFMSIGRAQEGSNKKELRLTYPKDSIVYFEQEHAFVKNGVYDVLLQFNNSIAKAETKKPVFLKLDNAFTWYQNILFFTNPHYYNGRMGNREDEKLDSVIAIHYWDSTITIENPNYPRDSVIVPTLMQITLTDDNTSCELRIPAGTFTDIYGNKNKAIHLMYKKNRK
jgi:hypothetical protein